MIRSLNGRAPRLGAGAFVHPAAEVIGLVELGDRASVWPRAVVRGDAEQIRVGDDSNVQDGAVLHADPGRPCTLGKRVTVGHLACVHGCTVEDDATVGIAAVVLNGARVGASAVVGAGAVVTEGFGVPPGSLAVGVPATVRREVPDAAETARRRAERYVETIAVHRDG